MIGQRENKSRYVTEIVFWLGFADVIFGGTSDRENTSAFAGYKDMGVVWTSSFFQPVLEMGF